MQREVRAKIVPRMTAKKIQPQKDSDPVELESKWPDRRKQVFMIGFSRKKEKKERKN